MWLKDGSVVLEARGLQFRVHGEVLSANSPIFADMFAVPQPAEEATIEGCPLVKLQDDAEDVELALRVIYDRKYVVFVSGEYTTH
jgi:hypothetical protein